jgi:cation diffusion facilitator family transporter
MHSHDLSAWTHDHSFGPDNIHAEKRTRAVLYVTTAMMVVEILAGWWFNSMALLADGWHMSSHAIAIGLSTWAYGLARRHVGDQRYAFGTWKIEVLGGFASAILLLGVAAIMVFHSVERLLHAQPIHYREALPVACLGLLVNLVCAVILARAGDHHHHAHESHGHGHHAHEDLNLRSAYVHVVADALTSVLAIAALIGGLNYGWAWLDPLMGVLGAVLVALWARRLLIDTGAVLLDREMDHPVVDEIRAAVETAEDAGATRISDLHVWRVGRNAYACALTLVSHDRALDAAAVRRSLAVHEEIAHVTVEIHVCD